MAESHQAAARSWTTKHLVWTCLGSLVVGGVLMYQAGFNWIGSWETGEEVGQKMAISACVRDFLLKSDRGVVFAELKDIDSSYKRRQLIRDQELAADTKVADACSAQIGELDPVLFPPA